MAEPKFESLKAIYRKQIYFSPEDLKEVEIFLANIKTDSKFKEKDKEGKTKTCSLSKAIKKLIKFYNEMRKKRSLS